MKSFKLFLVIVIISGLSTHLQAGVYSIRRNASGAFIQTDRDGSWYLDSHSAKNFRTGEGGTYSIGIDQTGTYIRTDNHGNLYIDLQEAERLEQEIENFNASQERQFKETETKVRINGNQVLVPVALGYQGKEEQAEFLLDTGASIIVLHREIAGLLGIRTGKSAELMVAGGKTISTYVATLNYVGVGPFRKERLKVAVIDHQGNPISHQGLLGMNFLQHFQYRIDFKRQVIVWSQ